MKTLNVFVYGTLMSGFRANSFIPENSKMLKGRIAGNLFHYAAGFPIVEILKHSQSVRGTRDYLNDVDVQENLNRVEPECLPFDLNYGRVHGELYMIPFENKEELEEVVECLDSYEGFTPESSYCLYNRTLVPVETEEGIIWAWVYNMETIPNATIQIFSGNWRDCFYSNRGGLRPEVNRAVQRKSVIGLDEEPIKVTDNKGDSTKGLSSIQSLLNDMKDFEEEMSDYIDDSDYDADTYNSVKNKVIAKFHDCLDALKEA